MKKTFLVVLVALIGFGTQHVNAQLDFGIVAGMNVGKADFKHPTHYLRSAADGLSALRLNSLYPLWE